MRRSATFGLGAKWPHSVLTPLSCHNNVFVETHIVRRQFELAVKALVSVNEGIMQLSTQQQMLVEQRLTNEKKSTGVAYLLWFFLGGFSAHRFYLGSPGTAAGQIALIWIGVILSGIFIGIPLLIAGLVWLFIDLFLIGGLVQKDAGEKRARLINEVALTTRAEP